MNLYRITQPASAVMLGFYPGESPSDALDELAQEAGYANYHELTSVCPTDPNFSALDVEEVEDSGQPRGAVWVIDDAVEFSFQIYGLRPDPDNPYAAAPDCIGDVAAAPNGNLVLRVGHTDPDVFPGWISGKAHVAMSPDRAKTLIRHIGHVMGWDITIDKA